MKSWSVWGSTLDPLPVVAHRLCLGEAIGFVDLEGSLGEEQGVSRSDEGEDTFEIGFRRTLHRSYHYRRTGEQR
jgi:hypothetical protein